MRRRGSRAPKAKKQKRVAYQLVPPKTEQGKAMYAMLTDLVEEHHEELTNARIALAWNLSWKPDVDGRVKLGQCKKRSDLDREFAGFDFVIVLRQEFWQHPTVNDGQRLALLDHELCHATVKLDREGEPALDERGRTVWRIRKHDIQEFSEVVARHGVYTRDLEHFAAALRQSKQRSLLEEPPKAATPKPPAAAAPREDGNLPPVQAAEVLTHVTAAAGEPPQTSGSGAYAFDGKEPPPKVVSTHAAVDTASKARTKARGGAGARTRA